MAAQILAMGGVLSLFMFIAFYMGFKVGNGGLITKAIPSVNIPQCRASGGNGGTGADAETEERRAERIFMENIENYGTSKPQKEV
ncbi:MAG: hypothetical protein RR011_04255 [Oscillospiraceae bacterium]